LVKIIPNEIPKSARLGYPQIMWHGQKMKWVPGRIRLPLLLAAFLACGAMQRAPASAEDQVDQAVAAARAWISQIDGGKYDESYAFTCDETRVHFPQDRWVQVLKALRKPWGAVINRHQLSHVYMANGVPGLNGECMVITYETNFKNLSSATETIVLKWEDGRWLGAGYRAEPPSNPDAAVNGDTETHTDEHVKPQPQSP
jgi:hypothetical protein